jgi:hypothetical protein
MANTLHQLKRATEIVERYRARGNVFPRELRDCGRGDPKTQQEYRDACKVKTWKYSLLGKNIYNCSDEIRDYLDENMPGWCDRVYSHQGQSSNVQMKKAVMIVERYRERGNVLPRRLKDPTKAQETKDAINISTWKSSLKGYNRVTCSKELCSYLDENMPGWRQDHHKSKPRSAQGKEKALRALMAGTTPGELTKKERSSELLMPIAVGIVERFHANQNQYPSLKLVCRKDPARAQEYSDAKQLHSWKSHTDKSLAPDVFQYLDDHMPEWKNSHVTHTVKNVPISKAREIFRRCSMRNGALPRLATCRQSDPALLLEHKDALKLREWKVAATTAPATFCPALKEYLDEKLQEWRDIDITSPLPYDMKTERAKAAATAALNKRKRDVITPNGTVGELSSGSGYYGSDTDDRRSCFDAQTKRMKLPPSSSSPSPYIDSDESAGIAALLQLSGAGPPPPALSLPRPPQFPPLSSEVIAPALGMPLASVPSALAPAPAPYTPVFPPAPASAPAHHVFAPSTVSNTNTSMSHVWPTSAPPPVSFSTYGNCTSSKHTLANSLYPVSIAASTGLELYLTGLVGRS